MAQPLDKIRAGAVSAAIWENEATVNGKTVTMFKASVERRFKDSNGTTIKANRRKISNRRLDDIDVEWVDISSM